jgi:hypothetical protein
MLGTFFNSSYKGFLFTNTVSDISISQQTTNNRYLGL